MKIKSYKQIDKGFVKGSASIIIENWGIEIYDITVFQKDAQKWISFPLKSYEKDIGQKKYFPYIRFKNPEHMKKFQAEFFIELEKWIAENPVLAPQESKAQLQEEIPF